MKREDEPEMKQMSTKRTCWWSCGKERKVTLRSHSTGRINCYGDDDKNENNNNRNNDRVGTKLFP